MTFELKVEKIGDAFQQAFASYRAGTDPGFLGAVTRAATDAIKDAGAALKTRVRAAIRSGGLSARFANAWRVKIHPAKGISLDAAAFAFHAIPYSPIFQEGGTIRGKNGLLWLPLPTVPKVGKRIARPRDLAGVKLFSISNGGGKPLLAAKIRKAGVDRNSRIRGQVSIAALRAGSNVDKIRQTSRLKAKQRGKVTAKDAGAQIITVPLFVGVPSVSLRKRFDLNMVAQQVSDQLPQFYDQRLKV